MAFIKEAREPGQSIMSVVAKHEECGDKGYAYFSRGCGVFICDNCGEHEGLARCFCGWSLSGSSGYTELIEMGEVIDD